MRKRISVESLRLCTIFVEYFADATEMYCPTQNSLNSTQKPKSIKPENLHARNKAARVATLCDN
jgi:hypothetical protein